MVTLANQRDDDWPISKYQETPAANQPLPTPCLCSKLINTAVNLGSGLRALLKTPLCWMRPEPWLELAIKHLYAFALLWTSYSLSFGDSDSGHTLATAQSKEAEPRPWGGGLGCEPQWTPRICCPAPRLPQVGFLQPTCPAFQEAELGPGHRDPRTSWDPECCLSASSSPGALSMGTSFLQGCGNFLKFIYF